ncbi:protein Lines homolog 1 isoform X1 [Tympanuchus pallidicinctus]|uniref:protein Lines homolog 1 isoform X1 n=2 Tax=Tympanuchus pallidicinctus TaxID=109042 RepID=UPI002286F10C|nr:protein Lines homolog 1 isoform X1 [Tympanuchus pallidicinctus]XP_052527754.1 protein Lines homolog 1 isoform X1 [Tympanuchus pallidicinctus]XP_052527755.1 protein Lines homolog 1 isoform X1 [Tympanuchus pallidicinctus]XP_052527756.1 protein Lines homolog 1 isoform X1 [Tympanuchus pallidicinctus]XP_052527757.1 protein Lines homolog 1 isoform X1 [Tympanuchus pallidicinctus]XP_052527758.1 protein Lines homolog 1 isoform X1 [Tympanuchus pallidicinctus]XP_052527759.1 protein Lines homolog 1 is
MKISLLQQMYKDVLAGTPLPKESYYYTSFLNLCVGQSQERDELRDLPSTDGSIRSHQDAVIPTADDVSHNLANMNFSFYPREVMLLQLTLIEMLVAKAESQEIGFSTRQKYCEILLLLLKETQVDSKLVCLLGSHDQLLSHMASKSLASLVYFQLKEENAVNVTWLSFSLKSLLEFPMHTQVAECLWTLTAVIKDVMKDKMLPGPGVLKLLAPLDAVLEGFYNSILQHHFDSQLYNSPYSKAANNLVSFVDLLEALLASRTELELPLRCQRVLFLKTSYVLKVINSSAHYFIKKKFIMLLKKCVLYKPQEDAVSGSQFLQNPYLKEDVLALSNAVLQVVNLTWLNEIPLSGKASYFGGNEALSGDNSQSGSDQTVLRALSLAVLKALEFKSRNSATEAEIKEGFESSMSHLLTFWRNHTKCSLHSHPVAHHCEWLSLVFIEQDDDMWEAAKALLLIYLKIDRLRCDAADNLSWEEEESWDFHAHANGYNPHCIFLFFLEKISFDSTVLLDFLISSETCFLEYLVRYLKLLREDWHRFVNICNHFDTKCGSSQAMSSIKPGHQEKQSCMAGVSLQNACCEPESQTLIPLASSHNYLVFTAEQGDNEVAKSNQSNSLLCDDNTSLLGSLQRLVNYDSSEDSELESVGEECLVNTKQMPLHKECETMIREAVCSYTDDKQNKLESEVLPLKQKGSNTSSSLACILSSDNIVPLRIMLYKSTKCLEELQKAISRLQGRNLFPYNPSALLRLLSHIEKISKNMNSQ